MLKLSRLYGIVLLAALLFCGCGQKIEEPKTDVQEKGLVVDGVDYLSAENIELDSGTSIAMVATNSKNSYWSSVEKGAAKAVEDLNNALGYSGKDKIKLSFDAPKGEDVIEQINIIDQFLDKAPDALCVAFMDASASKTQMDMAKNNGIKIICFDTPDDSQLTETIVATDNCAAAALGAREMFEAIDYEGKVAIIVHNSLTATAQIRKQAIIDEMTQNYNDKKIQFVEIAYTTEENRSDAELLEELLKKHEDLAGVICTDLETTEMVIDYASKLDEVNFKIVGFDVSEKILSEVGGLLEGTVAQDPYSMGYATVITAARAINETGNPESIYTEHVWIDAENLENPEIQSIIY